MFDFSKISVSDQDIEYVEKVFRFSFNNAQKALIRHWEPADIQACPGSGKTTTLAAKLILLSHKVPKHNRHGICVITHTNTAVGEIKSKLGDYGSFYQQYPNHFGTIQSFVDKYVAVPFYKHLYKSTPSIIDEWDYNELMRNSYPMKVDGTISYLDNNNVFLGGLTFNKFDFSVSTDLNTSEKWVLQKLKPETMAKYYEKICSAKEKLLSEGWLKYDEAYALAFRHIREHAKIIEFLRRRFPIVFVDEMQDMEQHQQEIIDLIFGQDTVLQRIGDTNQSIYGYGKAEPTSEWKPVVRADLVLEHSNRISDHLAETVRGICWKPQNMTGWANTNPISPVLFICNPSNIVQVKELFAKIVIENGLHKKGSVKVVGARRSDSRLNINSYWPEYNKKYLSSELPNLNSFLSECLSGVSSVINLKHFRKKFLTCFCYCLKLNGLKNPLSGFYFTPHSFLKYLAQGGNSDKIGKINVAISDWFLRLRKGEDIHNSVKSYVLAIISFFNVQANVILNTYLSDMDVRESVQKEEIKTYRYTHEDETVELIFDTIHGVKGETHTATLYVETYNRVYDIGGKLLDFIVSDDKGRDRIKAKDNASYKRLPHAYVALTRATDFFAICVDVTRYGSIHKTYFEDPSNGWVVRYIDPSDKFL
ncbi:UvrD-helicase domain-containing protein [Pedobacter sp. P26]|uniref:UvrD-helicase domain-containing protein n=1 Tax=Pedobacter sp. P26 TaxID=3423956 RepID=UPI003D666D4A